MHFIFGYLSANARNTFPAVQNPAETGFHPLHPLHWVFFIFPDMVRLDPEKDIYIWKTKCTEISWPLPRSTAYF